MDAWDGAILAIAAMLGGVLLVVLIQLVSALRSVQRLLQDLSPSLRKTACETAELSERLNRLSGPLADQGESLAQFMMSLQRLGHTVDRLNRIAQSAGAVGAAAGPAVAAAINAIRQAGGGAGAGVAAGAAAGAEQAERDGCADGDGDGDDDSGRGEGSGGEPDAAGREPGGDDDKDEHHGSSAR
jgi:uncharacterized protein YoxC